MVLHAKPRMEILPRSSSGQEPGLSIQVMGFDSPTGRLCGRFSSGKRAGRDPAKAGSIPVRPTDFDSFDSPIREGFSPHFAVMAQW